MPQNIVVVSGIFFFFFDFFLLLYIFLNNFVGVSWLEISFQVADVGESMFVHAFGAYFGLSVARVLYSDKVEDSTKEGSVYHSDLFSMIGRPGFGVTQGTQL